MTLQAHTVEARAVMALASFTTVAAFAVIAYAQFLAGRFFYGYSTQRSMAFIDKGQPVPGGVGDLNIFFTLILPNVLAFCLYLAVFWWCSPVPCARRARVCSALSVSAAATVLTFFFYMAAGIATYGS